MEVSTGVDRGALLSGLNEAQRRAVLVDAAVVRILAGAGSGKTRVLTRRIARRVADGEVDGRRVLAVTFTRKAATELRSRIGTLGLRDDVNAGTFHAIALAQLRQRWEERRITPPELLDRKVGFVARLMRARSSTAPLDVVGEIEWAKARMIAAADYPAAAAAADRRPGVDATVVAEVYARYEQEKLARRMVDFDDLLRLATRDLTADEEYAAARRWRFRHLFVDEFQDVNPLQFSLLRAWLGPQPDLCVVGDPNQAIYGWNGADAGYLDDLSRHLGDVTTVELTTNYRSSPQILGLANTVLSQTAARRFELVPTRGDGPVPTLRTYADETQEARAIARAARDRHAPGSRWGDQAVLVRTNAQLVVLAEAFAAAGIPHRSRGSGRLLDQPEVRDALRRLRVGSLAVGLADLERALVLPDDAGEEAAAAPAVAANDERAANLAELVRLGREFLDLSPEGSGPAFEAWARAALAEGDGGGDAVDLATFHAAKGLEWPVVTIAGMEDGLVPIHHARTAAAEAEEHRLLYVALTRAERELILTRAERRTFGTRSVARRPSPHLETIELAVGMLRQAASVIDLTDRVAAERARLRRDQGDRPAERRSRGARSGGALQLSADDRVLLDRLKRWRLDHARAAEVPAFVIFNDATLGAVAAARPTTEAQLRDVPGIGAVKLQRFGPELLAIVAEHLRAESEG